MYETQSSRQQQSGQQQSGQQQGNRQGQRNAEHSINITELALRGSAVLFDIQMAAIRSIWQLQTRSATAFGAPDYSDLLRFTDSGAKRLLSTGAEQWLTSARQASDTITEVQRQFGRLVEQGTMQLTEEMRQGIEELNQRTQDGLQEVKNLAQQGADEAERAGRENLQSRQTEQQRQAEQQRQTEQQQRQQAAGHAQPQVEQPRPEESGKQRRSA